MIDEKLIEIIKELKNQGKTDEEIRDLLLGSGVELNEISEHLEKYSENDFYLKQSSSQEEKTITSPPKEENASLKENATPSKKFNFKPLLIIMGIIIIALVILFLFLNPNQEPLPGTEPDVNGSLNDTNQSNQPDTNQSTQDNLTLSQLQLFSSYNYPLNETIYFDINFNSPDNNEKVNLKGDVYFKSENVFEINLNTTFEVDFNQEKLYSLYAGLATTSFFYPNFIVGAYNFSLTEPEGLEFFFSSKEYTDIPENQKLRYFVLKMLYPLFNILEEEPNNELSKLTSVILNKDYNFDVFNLSYTINHNQEKLTVFNISLDNSLKEVKRTLYNLETREAEVETMTYNELFGEPDSGKLSDRVIDLNILTLKESYLVGESLEGSEYFLSYQGEPFEGMVIYGTSLEGLLHTTYSTSEGIIRTGTFNDTLSIFKHSMYSLDGIDGNPNPFECDGNYIYSISVYDCEEINTIMQTTDCGRGGFPPTIQTKDIVSQVDSLKTYSKIIPVTCPAGVEDCCTNRIYGCSSNSHCLEGYFCSNYKCIPL
jgi:hypothetical protein